MYNTSKKNRPQQATSNKQTTACVKVIVSTTRRRQQDWIVYLYNFDNGRKDPEVCDTYKTRSLKEVECTINAPPCRTSSSVVSVVVAVVVVVVVIGVGVAVPTEEFSSTVRCIVIIIQFDRSCTSFAVSTSILISIITLQRKKRFQLPCES